MVPLKLVHPEARVGLTLAPRMAFMLLASVAPSKLMKWEVGVALAIVIPCEAVIASLNVNPAVPSDTELNVTPAPSACVAVQYAAASYAFLRTPVTVVVAVALPIPIAWSLSGQSILNQRFHQ